MVAVLTLTSICQRLSSHLARCLGFLLWIASNKWVSRKRNHTYLKGLDPLSTHMRTTGHHIASATCRWTTVFGQIVLLTSSRLCQGQIPRTMGWRPLVLNNHRVNRVPVVARYPLRALAALRISMPRRRNLNTITKIMQILPHHSTIIRPAPAQ